VFPGGRVEEFINNASHIQKKDMHLSENISLLAAFMAAMHQTTDVSFDRIQVNPSEPVSTKMMYGLWSQAAKIRFDNDAPKALKLAALQVGSLYNQIQWVAEEFENSGMGIVLCHRDMHCGNLMVEKTTGKSFLIDYEYSGMDYCAYVSYLVFENVAVLKMV